jgi:DNA-binding protein YbaB
LAVDLIKVGKVELVNKVERFSAFYTCNTNSTCYTLTIMFDKFKQAQNLMKMRSQAMQLKKKLEEISHSEEKDNVKVVVNGAQEVIRLEIDGQDRKDVVELINKAYKEIQKEAAKKMMEEGGGLSGLLGGMGQ